MDNWRYNPDDYAIGDDLWVQVPYGWSRFRGDKYTVTKKTPSGQLVAVKDGSEVRVSARGSITGESRFGGRSPCSAERAVQLNGQLVVDALWRKVGELADRVTRLSRQKAKVELTEAMAALSAAVDKLPA